MIFDKLKRTFGIQTNLAQYTPYISPEEAIALEPTALALNKWANEARKGLERDLKFEMDGEGCPNSSSWSVAIITDSIVALAGLAKMGNVYTSPTGTDKIVLYTGQLDGFPFFNYKKERDPKFSLNSENLEKRHVEQSLGYFLKNFTVEHKTEDTPSYMKTIEEAKELIGGMPFTQQPQNQPALGHDDQIIQHG